MAENGERDMELKDDVGSETERFVVMPLLDGRFGVFDLKASRRVRYSYHTPLYGDEVWSNYYSARGFCQALAKQVSKSPA